MAVICQDLTLAGAPCEPDPGPIYPPSWYDMYGDPAAPEGCMETEEGGAVCTATAGTNAGPAGAVPETADDRAGSTGLTEGRLGSIPAGGSGVVRS